MKLNLLSSVLLFSCIPFAAKSASYTAHEWGTFTSVQGSDGTLLEWRPLESSRLPHFVYDWQHPGLERLPTGQLLLGKGGLVSLQRMETPVIYFYADHPMTAEVSVDFPQGLITEWYPQATQIGPSTIKPTPAVAELDQVAHRAGARPDFTFASWFNNQALGASRVRWADVEIVPQKEGTPLTGPLLQDKSGSHYFAARDTESALLQIKSFNPTNPAPEREKFLFYRGVGNFATPLWVTMPGDDRLTLANTGKEPLKHLFVLRLQHGAAQFRELDQLAPEARRPVEFGTQRSGQPVNDVSRHLGDQMVQALTAEGLYPREATAMVNTWKDSWFAEEGVRVLYLLPRAWTDRTLPLALKPSPHELVRVMVGRAEVIAPDTEQELMKTLTQAKKGDKAAENAARSEFQKLGRFAQPAMTLAMRNADPGLRQAAWQLFEAASDKR